MDWTPTHDTPAYVPDLYVQSGEGQMELLGEFFFQYSNKSRDILCVILVLEMCPSCQTGKGKEGKGVSATYQVQSLSVRQQRAMRASAVSERPHLHSDFALRASRMARADVGLFGRYRLALSPPSVGARQSSEEEEAASCNNKNERIVNALILELQLHFPSFQFSTQRY